MNTDDSEALAGALKTIADQLQKHHGFSRKEISEMILQDTPTIPATAFNSELTPLEALARYCEGEPSHLKLLGRPKSTIQNSLKNSYTKVPKPLKPEKTIYKIPLEIFGDRKLSILEHICTHLKKEFDLSNKQIAKLVGKSQKTVWTVLSRAEKKQRGEV